MSPKTRLVAGLFLCASVIQASATDQQQPLIPNHRDATTSQDPFTSDFSSFVEQAMQDWHVAGLAISIVDGNETYAKVCCTPSNRGYASQEHEC